MKKNRFKTAFFIAFRYFRSKKRHNMVHIISIISMLGIAVSVAALIIVLSVFNGMEGLITKNINSFNSDLKVTLKEGKTFIADSEIISSIKSLSGVNSVEEIVEDMVLITYGERQSLVHLKGCSPSYIAVNKIDTLLIEGSFFLNNDKNNVAVLGAGIAGLLQLNLNSIEILKCYYPQRLKKNLLNPTDAFSTRYLQPVGVFATLTQYDEQYIFCPISFTREIMNFENLTTAIEIKLNKTNNIKNIKQKIENIVGDKFKVLDKFEQEEMLFKTIKNEKLIIFAILSFILLVATFNIIGTLGMLIIEKKEDISILKFLGASNSMIHQLFILEGMFISLIGGLIGMVGGGILCFVQQHFHIIRFGSETDNYIINYYPVQMQGIDFLFILLTVVIISFLASWFPTRKVTQLLTKQQ